MSSSDPFRVASSLCGMSSLGLSQYCRESTLLSSTNCESSSPFFIWILLLIVQVYGVFIEYLSQLPEDVQKRIFHILYDDNCHLAKFALRNKLVNLNDVTADFASKKKSIDKFHFGNHVNKWCLVKCNPYQHPELNNVNTMVSEQLFKVKTNIRTANK